MKLFIFSLVLYLMLLLSGCTSTGLESPPPLLPGPNPFIDRIFISLNYIVPVLLVVFIISVIMAGIYFVTTKHLPFHGTKRYFPIEIAQTRYASGDISREEYLTIINDLEVTDKEEKDKDRHVNTKTEEN